MKQKNKILLFAILALTLVSLFVYEKYMSSQPVLYPDFGIKIPAGYTTHGIDVSRYQCKIDWEEVINMRDRGQRISFAITKGTEGTNIVDPYFKKNWKKMKEQNLLRGTYLYFHTNRDAEQQAKFFINNTNLEEGDLPPVIDIEDTHRMSSEKIKVALKKCIQKLEEEYNAKPIIYTGVDFYERHLGEDFDEYPLWIAHYDQPDAPRIKREWLIWQHNCKGRVNGIRGDVDFNVVNGNLSLLQSLCL